MSADVPVKATANTDIMVQTEITIAITISDRQETTDALMKDDHPSTKEEELTRTGSTLAETKEVMVIENLMPEVEISMTEVESTRGVLTAPVDSMRVDMTREDLIRSAKILECITKEDLAMIDEWMTREWMEDVFSIEGWKMTEDLRKDVTLL
jgi:hypothetical protein